LALTYVTFESTAECENDDEATIHLHASADVTLSDYELYSVEADASTVFDDAQSDVFELKTTAVAAGNTVTVCATFDKFKKGHLAVLRRLPDNDKGDSVVVDVAHLPRYYPWDRSSARDSYMPVTRADIEINEDDWDNTVTWCVAKDASEYCELTPSTCKLYNDAKTDALVYNGECEIELKGHGSFQTLDRKPAFKLKVKAKDKDNWIYQYKYTFNNKVQDAFKTSQIDAYAIARSLSIPAPRANNANVRLFRGSATNSPAQSYVSVESVNADEFFSANSVDGNTVFEFQNTVPAELKHGPEDNPNFFDLYTAMDGTSSQWSTIERSSAFAMYALEVNVAHWDSVCRKKLPNYMNHIRKNNMYFMRNYSTSMYSFIPWGLDNIMRNRGLTGWYSSEQPLKDASCGYMRRCFNNRACSDAFDAFYADHPTGTFHNEHLWLIFTLGVLGIGYAFTLIILGGRLLARKNLYAPISNELEF
jgi:hypothetical protein